MILTESFWLKRHIELQQERQRFPARADVVIVGAGIAGLTTALELRKQDIGARIVVLDGNYVGSGASGRSAGLLTPVPFPVWLLSALRDTKYQWALEWVREQVDRCAEWIAQHLPDAAIGDTTLSLIPKSKLSTIALSKFRKQLEVFQVEAGQTTLPDTYSLQLRAHSVNPFGLVQGMSGLLSSRGVSVFEHCPVAKVCSSRVGVRVVLSGGQTIEASAAVICANAYMPLIKLPSPPRIRAYTTYMLSQKVDSQLSSKLSPNQFSVEIRRGFPYYRRVDDSLLFGAFDKKGFSPDEAVGRKMSKRLRSCFTNTFGRAHVLGKESMIWKGSYHHNLVDVPVISRDRKCREIVYNCGYGGTGLSGSLVASSLAASLASCKKLDSEHEAFRRILSSTRLPILPIFRVGSRALYEWAFASSK